MDSPPPDAIPCRVCGELTYKRCSRCKEAYYCSKEHIAADWPRHKPHCRAAENNPPDSGMLEVDAILLPVDEVSPRMIKVPYELEPSDEYPGITNHNIHTEAWMPNHRFYPLTGFIDGTPLGRTLMIIWNDNFLIDGSKPNLCVRSMNAPHNWCGNIIVVRANDDVWVTSRYYDAKAEDIPHIRRYFREYGASH